MRNIFTKWACIVLFTAIGSMSMAAERSVMEGDCNPVRNLRSVIHSPEWYNVSLYWDVPLVSADNSQQPAVSPFAYGTGDRKIYTSTLNDIETRTYIDPYYNASNRYSETTGAQLRAIEYIGGKIYTLDYISLTQVRRMGVLDVASEQITFSSISSLPSNIMSMSWHPLTGAVYVADFYGAYGKLDVTAKTYTSIGTIAGGKATAIAIDNYGVCYGIQLGTTGAFGTIDLGTGDFTKIADIPLYVNYVQDISVDHATNRLYWIARTSSSLGNTVLYEINKTTGALTKLADMPAEDEITAFCITSELADNPFTFNVYRDNQLLTPTPIKGIEYGELLNGAGEHVYSVETVYADCTSEKVNTPVSMPQDPCLVPITAFPFTEGFENNDLTASCIRQEFISGTVSWAIVAKTTGPPATTHSGDYKARFYNTTKGVKTRLVLPPFDVSNVADPTLGFWFTQTKRTGGGVPPANNQDTLSVYYKTSPTGEWKQLVRFADNVTAWREARYLLPEPSASYWIAFEGNSQYGQGILLDDIYVGMADQCQAPENVSAVLTDNDVKITWTAPETNTAFQSYTVYRNETPIATNITELTYTDSQPAKGSYRYAVEAIYNNHCGASEKVYATKPVLVLEECGDPVTTVNATLHEPEWYSVNLQWETPESAVSEGNWLTYSGNPYRTIGTGRNTDILVAVRWAAEDLTALDGKFLTSVKFYPFVTTGVYSVRVWTGGSATDPGTLIVDKPLSTASLKMGEWNEILLGNSVLIDASKELWIGIHSSSTTGNPAVADNGPIVANGKSNLIYFNGVWQPLTSVNAAYTYNWSIAGFIADPGVHLMGYNIYRDGVKLNTELFSGNSYPDNVAGEGKYQYGVSAVWDSYCESPKTVYPVVMPVSPCETPSTLPVSESFDVEKIPLCWDNISGTENNTVWKRLSSGTGPNCTPHSGAGMLQYNCTQYSNGSTGILTTPLLDLSEAEQIVVSFWMFRDDRGSNQDHVKLYFAPTQSAEGLTAFRDIYRGRTIQTPTTPAEAVEDWYLYQDVIDCSSVETGYILFQGISAYGSNIYIDDIKVDKYALPNNINLPSGVIDKVESLDIIDLQGKKIWSQRHVSIHSLVMPKLQSGIYLMRMQLPDGACRTEKIIIK